MKIINYGHACFMVIDDGVSVLFDPYKKDSVPGLNLPNKIRTNYLFMSHDHFDHNAKEKVEIVSPSKEIEVKRFIVSHDKCNGAQRGKNKITLIRFSDYSICHLGDVGNIEEIKKIDELKGVDIVLCPINGFFTISALEALELNEYMSWKLLIPMHYEKKEEGSGYPDGGQIDIFKKGIHYQLIEAGEVEINEEHFKYDSLIFMGHE